MARDPKTRETSRTEPPRVIPWEDGWGDDNWAVVDASGKVLSLHHDILGAESAQERAVDEHEVREPLTDDNGVRFEPWANDGAVGFRCSHPDGRVEFIYLNPSSDDTGGISNVFVYHGTTGDPASDTPYHFYPVLETE